MAVIRITGYVEGENKLSQLENILNTSTDIVTDTKQSKPALKTQVLGSNKIKEVSTGVYIDAVYEDENNTSAVFNAIKSLIGPKAKAQITAHRCNHVEFGGKGGPCEKPFLTLDQNFSFSLSASPKTMEIR